MHYDVTRLCKVREVAPWSRNNDAVQDEIFCARLFQPITNHLWLHTSGYGRGRHSYSEPEMEDAMRCCTIIIISFARQNWHQNCATLSGFIKVIYMFFARKIPS